MSLEEIRKDFPILNEKVNNKPLVYLDNAATTQKPIQVIDAMMNYYLRLNSNVHRGVHTLSQKATNEFELARKTVQEFISAKEQEEIIFTRGTTESINLVASSFCEKFLNQGDEIIISELEHHSNIVPWQLAKEKHKFKIKVLPFKDNGELDLEVFKTLLNSEKNEFLLSLLNEKYYLSKNLNSYLEEEKLHPNYTPTKIVSLINTHRNNAYYDYDIEADPTKNELILVNKYYHLDDNFEPQDLTSISRDYYYGENHQINKIVYTAFKKMWEEAKMMIFI